MLRKSTILCTVIIILLLYCIIGFHKDVKNLRTENVKLVSKIQFYEDVMDTFNIGEFISYPNLFYIDGYIEQVKVHNCMWAINTY